MIGSAAPALALQICRASGPFSFDAADDREGDDRFRRVSPVAARSGDRLLTDPTAGTQPWRREPLFMPLSRHSGLVGVRLNWLESGYSHQLIRFQLLPRTVAYFSAARPAISPLDDIAFYDFNGLPRWRVACRTETETTE
jgi:hypothetical protein